MKKLLILWAALLSIAAAGCAAQPRGDYGVFLGETEDLERLRGYKTVVVDAQYFSKEQIDAFKNAGGTVYSYLNIGSLEEFRDYYGAYEHLTLDPYENWEGEYWLDASDAAWRAFVTETLVPALLEKGVDGFLVDNCDVYYRYPSQQMLRALAEILRVLVGTGKTVLINGADVFLDAYCAGGGQWSDVATGIHQESVFTSILWDGGGFAAASEEDRAYFTDYIERYAAKGADVYLLEYTRERVLIERIERYCRQRGFRCCISGSLELTAGRGNASSGAERPDHAPLPTNENT